MAVLALHTTKPWQRNPVSFVASMSRREPLDPVQDSGANPGLRTDVSWWCHFRENTPDYSFFGMHSAFPSDCSAAGAFSS